MAIAALLAVLRTAASAQPRTFYDSPGKSVGRSTTDSQGSTTCYDSRGRVISRETIGGNTTTVYDAARPQCRAVHHEPLKQPR